MFVVYEARSFSFREWRCGVRGGLFMREVNNEVEAFAEMRRFLEVNQIHSHETTVYTKSDNKTVYMHDDSGDSVSFAIQYYDRPTYSVFDDVEKWKGDIFSSTVPSDVRKWHSEVIMYSRDLERRVHEELMSTFDKINDKKRKGGDG